MSRGRLTAIAACAAFLAAFSSSSAHAIDAYWRGERSDVWSDGISGQQSNWYSEPAPDGRLRNVPDHTATFTAGVARTSVVINRNTHIAQLLFEAKAPLYSFRIARSRNLTITLGIENHSKRTPRLKILDDAAVFMTGISQLNGASAAAAEITTADHAFLFFEGSSRGGNALVFNTGKSVVEFSGESSAEQMTITNRTGGKLYFEKKSTGDQAHIVNEAKGQFFCNKTKPFTLAIGRIDNDGLADLGFCTVEVAHSFAQGATGTLVVGVSKTSRFGALVVDKNATVGGTLDVDIDPAVPMPRTFKIVKAGGRRTGSFATLKIRGRKDVKGRLAYSSKEVSLIVEKK